MIKENPNTVFYTQAKQTKIADPKTRPKNLPNMFNRIQQTFTIVIKQTPYVTVNNSYKWEISLVLPLSYWGHWKGQHTGKYLNIE